MTRISLLLGMFVGLVACSPSSADPSANGQEFRSVEVDFRFAQVVEGHPAVDRLMDFVRSDGSGISKFDGITLSQQDGSGNELLLDGANRGAVNGYLKSVFARKPELTLPQALEVAFGPAPIPRHARWAKEATRAYWLDTTSQIEVKQVRSVTV